MLSDGIVGDTSLPQNWQKVLDASSNLYYYWNTTTNETTWDKPKNDSSSVASIAVEAASALPLSSLPPDWKQMVHAATKQVYYLNSKTGEKRASPPGSDDKPAATTAANDSAGKRANSARSDTSKDTKESNKKRRVVVDPLDPTGGAVRGYAA